MIQQEPSELAIQFKRKQIVVWGFLFLFMLATVSSIFYLAYRMISESGAGQTIDTGLSPIKIPASVKSAALSEKKHSGDYFLYGEFSPGDKKYKLYKVLYKESAREEILSFPWSNASQLPGLAARAADLAVFPSLNNGFFVDHNGSVISSAGFVPPSQYFSVSPNGKKMFYFKFMSSLGNPVLVLRDLEKDNDTYSWSLNSPASEVCDFAGWSSDGATAYCLYQSSGSVKLKAFNETTHKYSVIASAGNAADAKYYSDRSILIIGAKDGIYLFNTAANDQKLITPAPENAVIKNVFLAPDGARVFYTVAPENVLNGESKIYSIDTDGGGQKELAKNKNAYLVSLSRDGQNLLFKSSEHYFIADINGENAIELYSSYAGAGAQFIGWFVDNTISTE